MTFLNLPLQLVFPYTKKYFLALYSGLKAFSWWLKYFYAPPLWQHWGKRCAVTLTVMPLWWTCWPFFPARPAGQVSGSCPCVEARLPAALSVWTGIAGTREVGRRWDIVECRDLSGTQNCRCTWLKWKVISCKHGLKTTDWDLVQMVMNYKKI